MCNWMTTNILEYVWLVSYITTVAIFLPYNFIENIRVIWIHKRYKDMQTNEPNPWRCDSLPIFCLLGNFCSTWKISLFAIAAYYKSLLGVNISYLSLCVLFITVIKNTSWYSIFMYWSKKRNINLKTTEANIMKIRLIYIHDLEDIITKNLTK